MYFRVAVYLLGNPRTPLGVGWRHWSFSPGMATGQVNQRRGENVCWRQMVVTVPKIRSECKFMFCYHYMNSFCYYLPVVREILICWFLVLLEFSFNLSWAIDNKNIFYFHSRKRCQWIPDLVYDVPSSMSPCGHTLIAVTKQFLRHLRSFCDNVIHPVPHFYTRHAWDEVVHCVVTHCRLKLTITTWLTVR